LNKNGWYDKRFKVNKSTVNQVLEENGIKNLKEYYARRIKDDI
jgi:hypothetical protein